MKKLNKQQKCGYLVVDRKGEYIEDTEDQRGNIVFGLQNHPCASEKMVVVSWRDRFAQMKQDGVIHDHLYPHFSIRDIAPIDAADFMPGLTAQQRDLLRDYSDVDAFYDHLLAETRLGRVDKRSWYAAFPGLFEMKEAGKRLFKAYEKQALAEDRDTLTAEELDSIEEHLGGTKAGVLERLAGKVKRFCTNRFFAGETHWEPILERTSCLSTIIEYLRQGRFVLVDMRGQSDEDYTMVAALFARRLLTENKNLDDKDQIRACLIMEEAHNILSDDELDKGHGNGSVFIELAREGRSFKLGFILVTQQPDARSIAPQVAKTIDTWVVFNMPPDDARHLVRLKSSFEGLESVVSNVEEFEGITVSDRGSVHFKAGPVTHAYMQGAVEGKLTDAISAWVREEAPQTQLTRPTSEKPTVEDRLSKLMRHRQSNIREVALATMNAWAPVHDDEPDEDVPF